LEDQHRRVHSLLTIQHGLLNLHMHGSLQVSHSIYFLWSCWCKLYFLFRNDFLLSSLCSHMKCRLSFYTLLRPVSCRRLKMLRHVGVGASLFSSCWTCRGRHNHQCIVGNVSLAVLLRAFVTTNVSEVVIRVLVCNAIAMSSTVLSISDLQAHYQPPRRLGLAFFNCTLSHPYEGSKRILS
jgi:hypothetical protein